LFNSRKRFQNDICLICNPVGQSNFEQRVQEWIQTVYDGEIINNHRGFKKYELDIFLPELNVGIECNESELEIPKIWDCGKIKWEKIYDFNERNRN
jgi:hypothetical protein